MSRSRTARRESKRGYRRRLAYAAALLALVAVAGGGALALRGGSEARADRTPRIAAEPRADAAMLAVTEAPALVEVPNVVGKPLSEAQMVLSFAGFVTRVATGSAEGEAVVASQRPSAGARMAEGAEVILAAELEPAAPAVKSRHLVVVIDPGHQQRSDAGKEPLGPGSKEMKDRVSGGATGVSTRIPEYEVALQVSMRVKQRLEKAGVQVVMTRTRDDVTLSNVERAQVANRAGADLFLRVHANASPDAAANGISVLFPPATSWTKPISARSSRAAGAVSAAVVKTTKATSLGVAERGDIAGFNWSKVPAVLVECGFLSNPVEDKLLASPSYQDKLAAGISAGVLAYLGG